MIVISDHVDFITPAAHHQLRQAQTKAVWSTQEAAKSVPVRLLT